MLKEILTSYLGRRKVIGILLTEAVVYFISNTHLIFQTGLKISILNLS